MTTDPKRLADEAHDELGVRLIRAGRRVKPAADVQRRALAAASLAATATLSTSASGAAITLLGAIKWTVIGLSAAGVLSGATIVAMRESERRLTPSFVPSAPPSPPSAGASLPPPVRPEPPSSSQAAAPAPVVPEKSSEAHAPLHRPSVHAIQPPHAVASTAEAATAPAGSAAPAASNASSRDSTLTEELAAMDDARRAVASGQSAAALQALDDYASRYPRGRFAQEAFVLRIEALMQRGERGAATALAHQLLTAYPKSPAARKVRALLGLTE